MLFIATEKYPEVDGYFNFIESHGGFSNAYTDNDHTNFSSLRTEQQLGYVVQMLKGTLHNRGGVMFQIQSPVAPADVLEQRIISFVDERINVVGGYSNGDFKQHEASLISLLTESDKNLVDRSLRYWNNLDQGVLTFDARQQIADELTKLTIADMLAYTKEIGRDLQDRRILVFSRGGFDTMSDNAKPLNL
jgi:secreted Zn-dependent insulinase-like peptidase